MRCEYHSPINSTSLLKNVDTNFEWKFFIQSYSVIQYQRENIPMPKNVNSLLMETFNDQI